MVVPEDLMDLVIAADARRRERNGWAPARFRPQQRVWIEPPFNALGALCGRVLTLLPFRWRLRVLSWMCESAGGHAAEMNPLMDSRAADAVAMARELKRQTGRWPAALLFMTHAETTGPFAWLRFEMVRQGLQIGAGLIQAQRPGPWRPAPRCVLGIDPYALDTVSPAVGALYAGAMHQIHLAWDRQPSTQSWLQRHWLLRNTGHDKIAWRLLRALRSDVPVLMVLGGGLPANARLLYAAREFVRELNPGRWPYPKRQAEKELLEIVSKPRAEAFAADDGEISLETVEALRLWLTRLGVPAAEHDSLLRRFQEEFRRPVPYRVRLFSCLIGRLVRRGKPLLLLGIRHLEREEPPHVDLSAPLGVYASGGELRTLERDGTHPLAGAETLARKIGESF